MNSKEDNQLGSAAVAPALGIIFFCLALYAILAVAALIMTLLCLLALNGEITIHKRTITPDRAKWFLMRGIIGVVLVPMICIVICAMFGLKPDKEIWPHIVILGYSLGSVGLEYFYPGSAPAMPTPPPVLPQAAIAQGPVAAPVPQREPFGYASWKDEGTGS